MWGFPKALFHLPPSLGGFGILSTVDRTMLSKWSSLHSALYANDDHSIAAEGLLHRIAAAQGTHLLEGQGVILQPPTGSKDRWWLSSLLEWGTTFDSHLCRKGTHPINNSVFRPIIIDHNPKLIDICNSLQLHRLADLIDITTGNPQWLTPNPEIDHLLPELPDTITIPLTTDQYWKFPTPTSMDIFQILHWTAETIHIRRWSPTDQRMQYSRSPSTEHISYTELFPTRYSIRFSKLQAGTDTSIATMFLRRTQPRPQITAIPPQPLPQWITWCIQETVNAGINPMYYTSYTSANPKTHLTPDGDYSHPIPFLTTQNGGYPRHPPTRGTRRHPPTSHWQ